MSMKMIAQNYVSLPETQIIPGLDNDFRLAERIVIHGRKDEMLSHNLKNESMRDGLNFNYEHECGLLKLDAARQRPEIDAAIAELGINNVLRASPH